MGRNWIFGVLVAVAAFGCATAQKPAADAQVASNTLNKPVANLHCPRETGTRIKRPDDKPCVNQPGTAYSQQEIEETGQFTTTEALRKLDPRLQ